MRDARWLSQSHVFQAPFYYIEYGIAQLGALQLWRLEREDHDRAVDAYLTETRLLQEQGDTRAALAVVIAAPAMTMART